MSLLLALELSSTRGSVALCDADRVLARQDWVDPQARHPVLQAALQRVLTESGHSWDDVAAFAAGRGPGAFSGVRVALNTAQMLALPSARPVFAASSGEALARGLAASGETRPIIVAGDARRGMVWFARFERAGSALLTARVWTLAPASTFGSLVPDDAVVASPDWVRLSAVCGPRNPRVRWTEHDVFPDAAQVAALAQEQASGLRPIEPLEPLYMHPPV